MSGRRVEKRARNIEKKIRRHFLKILEIGEIKIEIYSN